MNTQNFSHLYTPAANVSPITRLAVFISVHFPNISIDEAQKDILQWFQTYYAPHMISVSLDSQGKINIRREIIKYLHSFSHLHLDGFKAKNEMIDRAVEYCFSFYENTNRP